MDADFPTQGNWEGLCLGWVAGGWLTHMLSEADQRLHHVQAWAARRVDTLSRCLGQTGGALDCSDDRLAEVLRALRDDAQWSACEATLTQGLLRVYALPVDQSRLDSPSASGYWSVTPAGLCQCGHSTARRPALPQGKGMLAALDPLGLPVATDGGPGQRADDPLDIPAITRVRESLGCRGLLYVGDCKMAALETRACVHAGGDCSVCPLSALHGPPEVLQDYLAPVGAGEHPVPPIDREQANGQRERLAAGYARGARRTAGSTGQPLTWSERRLVVRSLHQAQAGEAALRARLAKAQAGGAALNARGRGTVRFTAVDPLRQAGEAVVQRYRGHGLLRVDDAEHSQERRGRGYGGRPARVRTARDVRVNVPVDEGALEAAVRRLGGRVDATNQTAVRLSLPQAVLAYRNASRIARSCGRLQGEPVSLTPMDVERDAPAPGLIRLLSMGLRVLTRLACTVRRRLALEGRTLVGLYAGNPPRATAQPTAARRLEAWQALTLTIMQEGDHARRHLTPLSKLPQRILVLVDFTPHLSTRLCADCPKPP